MMYTSNTYNAMLAGDGRRVISNLSLTISNSHKKMCSSSTTNMNYLYIGLLPSPHPLTWSWLPTAIISLLMFIHRTVIDNKMSRFSSCSSSIVLLLTISCHDLSSYILQFPCYWLWAATISIFHFPLPCYWLWAAAAIISLMPFSIALLFTMSWHYLPHSAFPMPCY